MKSNELFEQIHAGQINDNTKIKVINELTGDILTVIKYKEGMLKWKTGEFDTSFLCNIDIEFVIEENKEIEEMKEINKNLVVPNSTADDIRKIIIKINELVQAVNKINKDLEKSQILNIEINEETVNNAIKRARNYIEREEK